MKANKKLRALAKGTPYMKTEKKNSSQFNYCPLTWMLHSHQNNNIVKHLHERFL